MTYLGGRDQSERRLGILSGATDLEQVNVGLQLRGSGDNSTPSLSFVLATL